MCDLISYHIPEAVRIEVIEVSNDDELDLHGDENTRRFSIDPQITDLSVLHSIIVRAFSIRSDFTLNYLRRDLNTFVPLKSDWDLDSAYINSSKPFLFIRMTTEKYNSLTDWDIITVADITRAAQIAANQTTSVANTLLHKVEKIVSKAFSRSSPTSQIESNPSPLNEKQYYSYLDSEGRIRSTRELRISIFRRGVDPILRRAVWKHLLNVYPPGLTGNQRFEYIKEKADEYHRMKNLWSSMIGSDEVVDYTINMVNKDVLRTDRMHPFYLGSGDDNPNVVSLLNILTTFALNHGVKYCQGMSDLVSPLLYAMKDEAQAYICFCALMRRLRENFTLDGQAISCKFDNLSRLLQYYDPDFYLYLKQVGAQDLLFCYRWILLELKREFPFDCALTMLEVLWSSIPPLIIDDLPLFEDNFRFQIGGTADALTLEAELANGYHQHHSDGEGNEGDVDEDVDADVDADLHHDDIDEDEDNYQKTNLNKRNEQNVNKIYNQNNNEYQTINNSTSITRKQSNSSRNVKIPINNRRFGYRYGDRFCLMNHSLPEYGARFECADLENSGSIRIKGFFLNHNDEVNLSSLNQSSIDNHQILSSSTVIPGKSVGRVASLMNHSIGVNGFSVPTRNSLPHIMKSNRPLRTIRFLPKILSNDSREIDSPDAEESSTKQYSFPPKFDKGFSIDSDGDCRRLNSFESMGSSKNSSVDLDEDVESAVRHEGRTTGASLIGLKAGSNDSGSSSSSSSSSSAAVRLRCQQRRRLFCRLGSSGGRDNSEPGSPLSPHSGSFGNVHEVETEYEQDLIVHCNGEYTDSRVNQQDWIIPRGLARSVSYECLKNLTVTSDSQNHENTCNGPTSALSVNGLRGSASNGSHLNGTGLTTNPDEPLGSRNSSSQGLEKERSEGYGSGSDPSDLMSEVHSAFGGTLDGNKSDSSSCSSLVILNSNGSTTTESTGSPSSSSQPLSTKPMLPSPSQLGSSNAFMLFLCLSILLQHRDKIMSSGLDCNEIAVYFDSYIRRHNVHTVLDAGRQLFHSYLSQWRESGENETDLSQDFPPTT